MIKVRPAGERGKTRTSWLHSSHTFSFNRYCDPAWSGFGSLLVINEDFVAPSQGFGRHSHENMEILSYVVEGALEHRDSSGGSGVIRPNELQRMSAGTGISHSESNPSSTRPVHFLQIWILPERNGLAPEYEQREFPASERSGRLRLIASRDGRDVSVVIHQDANVYDAVLGPGGEVVHRPVAGRRTWIQVIRGSLSTNGTGLETGDGAAIIEETSINIKAERESEMLLFDLG
ncbi:MAG TPA: pirin family protein [Blastocatellia bacterium]|nr:pirin family protein [Blastocatellia bacterium]